MEFFPRRSNGTIAVTHCAGEDVTTICGRLWTRHTEQQRQGSRDHERSERKGLDVSRPLPFDWRQLSKAARQERDPQKFGLLLKQLYDMVNEGDKNAASVAG